MIHWKRGIDQTERKRYLLKKKAEIKKYRVKYNNKYYSNLTLVLLRQDNPLIDLLKKKEIFSIKK